MPETIGPKGGHMNGEAVKIIIGACSSLRTNISPTVPPATPRNALPATPLMNRATSFVAMFFESAQGMSPIRRKKKET
ncbi:hypothetical protein ABVK25_000100 [Lepraria finkii]|uniref:Uncharacterized protein n=1 Tax=Lepraria finkii TaxID=1340010 RepID=A0ABR4BLY5_9LECA